MRSTSRAALCGLLIVGAGSVALAQPPAGDAHAAHHHAELSAPPEQLGHITFPTSCHAKAQHSIERGIAWLHSFGYTEARSQFEAAVRDEPGCAIAHWGIAMSQFHELWEPPDAQALELGRTEMAKARSLSAPPARVSARERRYIEALSAFYEGTDVPLPKRTAAYEARMDALHAAFPDDIEAAAFDALAILASEPPDDRSLEHEHRALAILQPLFLSYPQHPGLAHYIIHTCDTPALAPEGLQAARVYAQLAPASPHALHMPGHIFARLGMWPEDIESNLASVAASRRAEAAGQPGAAHQMHAIEFLIYAYLQVGQEDDARPLVEGMQSLGTHMKAMPGMDDMKDAGPFFDNELRVVYAMEMHDWSTLAKLQPGSGSQTYHTAPIYWGQAVAAGHLGDATLAAAALKGYETALEALRARYGEGAGAGTIRHNEILGWKALAEGNPEDAIGHLRAAADEQDKVGQNEVDIPAREMLGDVLLSAHRPQEALAEYRVALRLSPNRLNALLSAASAAKQAGLEDEARGYDRQVAAQTHGGAHSHRADVAQAVAAAQAT